MNIRSLSRLSLVPVRTCALGAILLTASLVAGGSRPASAQELLSNGGFESGALGVWTTTGNASVNSYAVYNGLGGTNAQASYGAELLSFNSGDSAPNAILAQSFATVAGAHYSVSFLYGDFSASGSPTTQAVNLALYNGTFTATQILSTAPTSLASQLFTSTASGASKNYPTIYGQGGAFGFDATGTTTTIAFADQPTNTTSSSDGILDNVSVLASASASAPEPADLALVGMGAVPVLGAAIRRRKVARRS